MAREYPRFLFSNPSNTKSKGPFIVHLLEPRLVFKVVSSSNIVCLDPVYDTEQAEKIAADALKWLHANYATGLYILNELKSKPDPRVFGK